MQIDNFYFVVQDLQKSIEFYKNLFEENPTTITENRWADWKNENGQIYFGIISLNATGEKFIKGNNGVLGLYTENIDVAYQKMYRLGAKILYAPESIENSIDNYICFAIEDLDGNKIEIAHYDK